MQFGVIYNFPAINQAVDEKGNRKSLGKFYKVLEYVAHIETDK